MRRAVSKSCARLASSMRMTQLNVPSSPTSASASRPTPSGWWRSRAGRTARRAEWTGPVRGGGDSREHARARLRPLRPPAAPGPARGRDPRGPALTTARPASPRARGRDPLRSTWAPGPSNATMSAATTASAERSGRGMASPRPGTAAHSGHGPLQDAAHALVGFHGHDVVGVAKEHAGQSARPRPQVDDRADVTAEDPLHGGVGWAGPVAGVVSSDVRRSSRHGRPAPRA